MAPLPPYGTDEPDSFYESPQHPQRRQRQLTPPDQKNNRTSAYDVYDDYLTVDPTTQRQSGVGGIGLGFLNGSMDDSDDESDEDDTKVSMPMPKYLEADPLPSKSKHDQLLAATRSETPSPPPQYIASPKPGYAAPIAALNLAKPEPTAAPGRRMNPNLNITVQQVPMFPSPSPSLPGTPHPLQAPLSPITPAFARPRPRGDVTFEDKGPIMRGDKEETLLPKRGEKGDDFWRRFSMIAREDRQAPKQSPWLAKTRNGARRLSAWVWIIGLVLLLCAGGGIGIGWYLSHKSPDHQRPSTFGAEGKEAAASTSSTPIRTVGSQTVSVKTSLHVSPTNTVARREPEPQFTGVPLTHRRARRRVAAALN